MEGKNRIQKLRMTQILTWKPELGKNHVESTNSETEHYERKEYNQRSQRQRPRDPASPTGGYGAHTLPLTLVHSHSYGGNNLVNSNFTITHISNMIALSTYILM